jgi:hypothetical protein
VAGSRLFKNVRITNRDSELLNKVSDISQYQMAFQVWRKHPGLSVPRTVIFTPTTFLLCDEDLTTSNVQLTVLDSAAVKDVHKVSYLSSVW